MNGTTNEVRRDRHEWYVKGYLYDKRLYCRHCGVERAWEDNLTDECVWRPEPPAAPATTADAQRLEEIRQREQRATEGPWWVHRHDDPAKDAQILFGDRDDPRHSYDLLEHYEVETDYEFMAHARQDIPWLLAIIDKQNVVVEAAVHEYRDSKYDFPFRTRKAIAAYLGEEQ